MGFVTIVRRTIAFGIGAGLLAVASVANAAVNPQPVGFVYDMSASPAAYAIMREGQTQSVADRALLFDGDTVKVLEERDRLGKAAIITLWIRGRLYSVDFANSPFCIGSVSSACKSQSAGIEGNPIPKIFWSVLESVGSIFEQARQDTYSSQVDQMVARGASSSPTIPMLPASPLAIEPVGSPILAFEWLGGEPPFAVLIRAPSGQTAAKLQGVEANSVAIEGLHFVPGRYRVKIADAQGRTASAEFACSTRTLPVLSIDAMGDVSGVPAVVISSMRAALLARQGREWYLAAYQILATLPDDAQKGQVHDLRFWLAEGLPPQ
jgi:hypothetical protein